MTEPKRSGGAPPGEQATPAHRDMGELRPDKVVDTSGKLCPIPIVEAAKAIGALPPGGVLLVVSTDPGIEQDMPMWCKATRHEHLGTIREGAVWKSFIRKRGS